MDDDSNVVSRTVVITAYKRGPKADAGSDTAVSVNDDVFLSAAASSDETAIVEYAWKCGDGEWLVDVDGDTTVTAPATPQTWVCSLKVVDNDGNISKDKKTIPISDVAPICNAGSDTTVSVSDDIFLSASASSDETSIVEYAWKCCGGDWVVDNDGDTTVTAPETPQTCVCSLRVVDEDGDISKDSRTILTSDNAPSCDAGRNATVGIGTEIHLRPAAADDGKIGKFEWKIGTSEWIVVSGHGDTTFIAPIEEGELVCAVCVTDDDGHTSCDSLTITISLFGVHVIDSSAKGARSVYAVDIDGDGDMDVLQASYRERGIMWYENSGTKTFDAHLINGTADGATSAYAADMDGDSDVDILSTSVNDNSIRWYENNGTQTFAAHTIDGSVYGANSVYPVDLDSDGDMDVLSASTLNDGDVRWYENNGVQPFALHTINKWAWCPTSVYAVDMDGDGDKDVLSASSRDSDIMWYENKGTLAFVSHKIYGKATGASSVYAVDMDVLSASGDDHRIRWYENNGVQTFSSHKIFGKANGASSVYAADMDGDGDMDVLSASSWENMIRWYENHSENLPN